MQRDNYFNTLTQGNIRFKRLFLVLFAALAITACNPSAPEVVVETDEPAEAESVTIKLARFFGECEETTIGVTDVSQATTECEAIQIITNKFNAENDHSITVERLGGANWGVYYDALNTSFTSGFPPDVAVMHGSNLPDYVNSDLLYPLSADFTAIGIDPEDWTVPARNAVMYEDNFYGVPFDLHANLFHINVDLFKEAGLVDDDGQPILPTSRSEFMEQAQIMKEKTGKNYVTADFVQYPIAVRVVFTLVWQQNSDLITTDGKSATVDTPQAQEAVGFMLELFENGYANPALNYEGSQQLFLDGEAAILWNGTWAVDQYNHETTFAYQAVDFPTLYDSSAVWANSHMWVAPKQSAEDPAKYQAVLQFLKFLHDHVGDWAVETGHLAPRQSVLQSATLLDAPQRGNYANTANIARLVPAIENWQIVEDILQEEIQSIWTANQDPTIALSEAETHINEQLAGE